jgi:hypothetical protein
METVEFEETNQNEQESVQPKTYKLPTEVQMKAENLMLKADNLALRANLLRSELKRLEEESNASRREAEERVAEYVESEFGVNFGDFLRTHKIDIVTGIIESV